MPIPVPRNCCSSPYRLFFSFPTACQCCWPKPKLNAFVPSLFSLTLIEFCEFHLPLSPASTVYAFSFIQCVVTVPPVRVAATNVFLQLFYLLALWPLIRLAAGATFIWLNLLWTITKTVENCCPRRGEGRERERDVRQVRLASCPLILQSYRNCAHLHHMVNGTSFPRKMAYISRPARPVRYGTARLGLPFCQATVKLSCFASNPLLLIFN